jgi:hypothetical protein
VRIVVLVAFLSLMPAIVAAQGMEIGGSVAAGCLGSDGSVCGSGNYPLFGAHIAWLPTDSIELAMRVAHVGLPAYTFQTEFPVKVQGTVADRSRVFVSAIFIYHFLPDQSVQPILGFGVGGFARNERIVCEPTRCDGIPGLPREGPSRTWMRDIIFVAGFSGRINDHWQWHGGWLSHRFLNDQNSTIELLFGVGYRFGGH